MTNWSGYVFGAAIFFGAGVMMLAGQLSEWWTIVSLVAMVLAAAAFLIRSIVDYRRTHRTIESSGQRLPSL